MSNKPLKIEELLERMGESDFSGDVSHRYELRRTLLCSRYFDEACHRDEKRSRFLAYTAPLFAGTVLVIVFAVAGTSILDANGTLEPQPTIDTSHLVSSNDLSTLTFVSAHEPSRVDLAEFVDTSRPPIALRDALRFVPMDPMLSYSVR